MPLKAGDTAPAFALPDQDGNTVRLADFAGRSVVLYCYPKDDTPGCTTEARQFSELVEKFQAAGITVLGISPDSPAKHAKFRAKYGLTVTLVSDEPTTTLTAYGVYGEKSMYGRKYMGVDRTTFLIGPDGRIARVWEKVKADGHAGEVLSCALSG